MIRGLAPALAPRSLQLGSKQQGSTVRLHTLGDHGHRFLSTSTLHGLCDTASGQPEVPPALEVPPDLNSGMTLMDVSSQGRRTVLIAGLACSVLFSLPASAVEGLNAAVEGQTASGCYLRPFLEAGPWLTRSTSLHLDVPTAIKKLCPVPISVTYPSSNPDAPTLPQLPLVVFSPGFLVDSSAYTSYCDHLASWGFVTVIYSIPQESAFSPLTNDEAAHIITRVINTFSPDTDSDSSDDDEDDGEAPEQEEEGNGAAAAAAAVEGASMLGGVPASSTSSAGMAAAAAAVPPPPPGEALSLGTEGAEGACSPAAPASDDPALAEARAAAEAAVAGRGVLLVGHSRGAKLSVLAAAALMSSSDDNDSEEEEGQEEAGEQLIGPKGVGADLDGMQQAGSSEGGVSAEGAMALEAGGLAASLLLPSSAAVLEGLDTGIEAAAAAELAATPEAKEAAGSEDADDDGSSSDEDDPRVLGLALIDPVDLTYDEPPGALSSLPALQELLGQAHPPGVLIVGAGGNADCIPRSSNYGAFFKACTAAQASAEDAAAAAATPEVLMVVVKEAGHLQFLDNETTMQRSACRQGKLDEEKLRQLTRALLAWWSLKLSAQANAAPGAAAASCPAALGSSSNPASEEGGEGPNVGRSIDNLGIGRSESDPGTDIGDAARALGLAVTVQDL